MDLNDVRNLVTLLSFVLFLALMAWTYWPTRKQAYAEAEQLPFLDDASDARSTGATEQTKG